jgi:hypothetical protein
MKEVILEDFITSIQTDCSKSDIQVFYGSFTENDLLPVHLVDDQRKDWNQYFQVVKSLGIRLITVSADVNEIDNLDTYRAKIDDLDEEDQKRYQEALSIIEKNENRLKRLQVHFFYDSVCYQLSMEASWYVYCQMLDMLYDINDDDEDDDLEDNDEFEPPISFMAEEEIERRARLIINKSAYLQARNYLERRRLIYTFKELDDVRYSDRADIQERAEEIFQAEILPKQEEELRNKILELKQKGLKKIHIKAKLSITDQALNRHYYDD